MSLLEESILVYYLQARLEPTLVEPFTGLSHKGKVNSQLCQRKERQGQRQGYYQGDQKIGGKLAQFLDKVAKTVAEPKKCQNIFFKAQFESKYQHQTFPNS